jgi:hypothetical protein
VRLGLENRREVAMMVVLFLAAGASVYYTFFREAPKAEVAVRPRTAGGAKAPARRVTAGKVRRGFFQVDTQTLDPTLRLDWLKLSEGRTFAGGKRNLFGATADDAEVEPPCHGTIDPKTRTCVEATTTTSEPPKPPIYVPPPINLRFFGFASRPGEPRRIFLAQGEDVFVASEGEIVARRYRVVKINAGSVEIEDVLNNNRQTIPLSQG